MASRRVALPLLVLSQSGAVKSQPQASAQCRTSTNQSIPVAPLRAFDVTGRVQKLRFRTNGVI